jgi:hypothetical protein
LTCWIETLDCHVIPFWLVQILMLLTSFLQLPEESNVIFTSILHPSSYLPLPNAYLSLNVEGNIISSYLHQSIVCQEKVIEVIPVGGRIREVECINCIFINHCNQSDHVHWMFFWFQQLINACTWYSGLYR